MAFLFEGPLHKKIVSYCIYLFTSDILCIYISNVIPFPYFSSGNLLSHSPSLCFYGGAPPSTHPLTPHQPGIPLHWGIKSLQDQGPLLLLMPDNAILCYMCNWSYGSLHVYSLVGDLVPGSSGGGGGVWLVDTVVLPMGLQTPSSSFSPFSNSSIEDTMLSPMVGCEHLPLYLSGSGRASQETTISGSCQ